MIIKYEIEQEIAVLQEAANGAKTKGNDGLRKWLQERVHTLTRIAIGYEEQAEEVSKLFKQIGNLNAEIGKTNQELIEANRALAVAKATLEKMGEEASNA